MPSDIQPYTSWGWFSPILAYHSGGFLHDRNTFSFLQIILFISFCFYANLTWVEIIGALRLSFLLTVQAVCYSWSRPHLRLWRMHATPRSCLSLATCASCIKMICYGTPHLWGKVCVACVSCAARLCSHVLVEWYGRVLLCKVASHLLQYMCLLTNFPFPCCVFYLPFIPQQLEDVLGWWTHFTGRNLGESVQYPVEPTFSRYAICTEWKQVFVSAAMCGFYAVCVLGNNSIITRHGLF